ncbi:MAG: response regulator, partial [Candidatus Latescibacterota bacterium]
MPGPDNQTRTILVVDDHASNRKLLRVTLEAEGFAVVEASDGVEALALLGQHGVDAIVSDILMPRMDGFRLCSQVRHSPRFGHLPLLIYTATYLSPSDEKLARQMGADEYLRKPVPTRELVEALGR